MSGRRHHRLHAIARLGRAVLDGLLEHALHDADLIALVLDAADRSARGSAPAAGASTRQHSDQPACESSANTIFVMFLLLALLSR